MKLAAKGYKVSSEQSLSICVYSKEPKGDIEYECSR